MSPPRKSGFKPCRECSGQMSITDLNEDCLWCLSSDNNVEACSSCRQMNLKALKEREAKFMARAKKQKRGCRRSRPCSKSSSPHTSRSSKRNHKKKQRHGSWRRSSKDESLKSVFPSPRSQRRDDISLSLRMSPALSPAPRSNTPPPTSKPVTSPPAPKPVTPPPAPGRGLRLLSRSQMWCFLVRRQSPRTTIWYI